MLQAKPLAGEHISVKTLLVGRPESRKTGCNAH
jgi:hypothetical protein